MRWSFLTLMVCFVSLFALPVIGFALLEDDTSVRPVLTGSALLALGGALLLWRLRTQLIAHVLQTERGKRERSAMMTEDEITGALTRRVFLSACEDEMRRIGKDRVYGLFAVDMDYLKLLNDSLGHTTGDFALRHLVKVIRRTFSGAIVGRLGGDEFGIFTPVAGPAEAEALCRRCLDGLQLTEFFEGRPMSLSASIGIAISPVHTRFFSELMHCADLALYESKRNGRGQATLFNEEMLRDRQHQRFVERELRAAILLDELSLVYQPIVNIEGTIACYEALVRWNHPVRGQIPPADFIPIAEQSLLIDLLGEWVMRHALADAADFGDRLVAVNVSPSQLKRDDVVDMVRRVLVSTGIAPGRVVLEMTESVAMTATPDVLRRFEALREMGLSLSLDDFGTGYCGFGYLRTFPVETIKIDRSYIKRLGNADADNVVVAALASVARAMTLEVVAEGIETEEQLELAKAAGCQLFQGYHIARPMKKADLMQGIGSEQIAA